MTSIPPIKPTNIVRLTRADQQAAKMLGVSVFNYAKSIAEFERQKLAIQAELEENAKWNSTHTTWD
jgi:hypothetical protein